MTDPLSSQSRKYLKRSPHRPAVQYQNDYGRLPLNWEVKSDGEYLSNGSWAGFRMSDTSRLKATVYVGGLDQAVTARTLSEAFIPFGEIAEVSLPKPELPSSTDSHRGFGYVEFEEPEDAKEAIDNMDQSELYGRIIKVAAAKPMKDKDEGLGSRTAIWEQEGYLAEHAVSEEDRIAAQNPRDAEDSALEAQESMDPMQGLEGLDVAGPRMA